ncbi:hypothetical protein A1O3_03905 [Capronia epimyces CBS 606.96]|uniref:Sugar phosphate transporter domain-containing protein n=1 Tax=Capronia epimyces CBS 606.96 TaxID=1182542 RepID=W9YCI3_9EURO|nr:uncharacterized protein A1O3_03905 [Capronia epimyces CBS 606.96]EXJ86951.1 hypothetical protein A1O3_03905 [Capronia epimyces CBS 606.96]
MSSSNPLAPSFASRRRGKIENIDDRQRNGPVAARGHGTTGPTAAEAKAERAREPTITSKTMSALQIWAPTLVLIFGGCCSNVYTLESLIQTSPSSGSLITAFQFLLVALASAPRHFSFSRGWRNLYLRERSIPLRKWIAYTAYFLSINMLNNMAFKYQISIPLHIILRSAGPVTTMAVGRVWGGKRYPVQKVIAVVLLFVGVVLAAFSDAWSKQAQTQAATHIEVEHHSPDFDPSSSAGTASASAISSQAPGFALLASALLLSACMGLYADDMYATYGRSGAITAEALFYSHAMSLPLFASQTKPLMKELINIAAVSVPSSQGRGSSSPWFDRDNSSSTSTWAKLIPFDQSATTAYFPVSIQIPRPVLLLLLNAMTQLLCIVGVNRLSAQSSSLTVSIVLNVRKLASLILSISLFGNTLPFGVMIGAAVVFVGGGLYALPARPTGEKEGMNGRRPQKQKRG